MLDKILVYLTFQVLPLDNFSSIISTVIRYLFTILSFHFLDSSSVCSVPRPRCPFCGRSLHDQEFPNEPISCFRPSSSSLTHQSFLFFCSTPPYFELIKSYLSSYPPITEYHLFFFFFFFINRL